MRKDDFKKRIHVVAGIIWNADKTQLLISKRLDHVHQGGLWEFPGGKVDVDEAEEEALSRELYEELNIRFSSCEKFRDVDFDYPDKQLTLSFYHVYDVVGCIYGNQGQEWCWVFLGALKEFSFPPANQPIVDELVKII